MYKPMRKITNRRSRKVIGLFYSFKTKKHVPWEERLEKDFVYFPEFDKSVLEFYSQPMKIEYTYKSKNRVYTPDYLLIKIDRRIVVEVKPEKKLKELEKKYSIIKAILEKENYEFLVLTDRFIRKQPRLENIKRLNRYKTIKIRQFSLKTVIDYFKSHDMISGFYESKEELEKRGVTSNEFFALIFHGYLMIDINEKISWYSLIALNENII